MARETSEAPHPGLYSQGFTLGYFLPPFQGSGGCTDLTVVTKIEKGKLCAGLKLNQLGDH